MFSVPREPRFTEAVYVRLTPRQKTHLQLLAKVAGGEAAAIRMLIADSIIRQLEADRAKTREDEK